MTLPFVVANQWAHWCGNLPDERNDKSLADRRGIVYALIVFNMVIIFIVSHKK